MAGVQIVPPEIEPLQPLSAEDDFPSAMRHPEPARARPNLEEVIEIIPANIPRNIFHGVGIDGRARRELEQAKTLVRLAITDPTGEAVVIGKIPADGGKTIAAPKQVCPRTSHRGARDTGGRDSSRGCKQ